MSTQVVPVPIGSCDWVMVNIRRHDYQCMSMQEYEKFNEVATEGDLTIALLFTVIFIVVVFCLYFFIED